ncbi:MAG TPA: hypothetical protein VGB82_18085 [Alphaproteobacteria bacterium]
MTPTTVQIGLVHYIYLCGVIAIIVSMMARSNVVVPAMIATFLVALTYSGSVITGVTAIFNGSLVAAKELFNIFLVIALMTSLLNALRAIGADVEMVKPFRRIMTNGHVAFLLLSVITYLISLFFWPTPAVPIVAATLLPAAILAGLPPMGAAVAIAIAGQGMALSSDYVIRVAPAISAKAAGITAAAGVVADKALVLSLITGIIALIGGYLAIRRSVLAPDANHLLTWQAGATLSQQKKELADSKGSFDKSEIAKGVIGGGNGAVAAMTVAAANGWTIILAAATPLVFLLLVACMLAPKFVDGLPDIKGGDAAALVGGTAALLMLVASFAGEGRRAMNVVADHVIDGLVFAFKAMGAVLPIAGFFFIGASDTAGAILGLPPGAPAPAFLFEIVQAAQNMIPHNHFFVAFGVLIVGMITGIDGSGFAGLPLTGALSGALAPTVHMDTATLAAVGQMGSVWTGGGTLIAWSSLIAVAGFARVPVLDLVRILFGPVILGLIVSTIAAVVIW